MYNIYYSVTIAIYVLFQLHVSASRAIIRFHWRIKKNQLYISGLFKGVYLGGVGFFLGGEGNEISLCSTICNPRKLLMLGVVMTILSDKILSGESSLMMDEHVSLRNFGLNILRKKFCTKYCQKSHCLIPL
jgi:hypothetical protein